MTICVKIQARGLYVVSYMCVCGVVCVCVCVCVVCCAHAYVPQKGDKVWNIQSCTTRKCCQSAFIWYKAQVRIKPGEIMAFYTNVVAEQSF